MDPFYDKQELIVGGMQLKTLRKNSRNKTNDPKILYCNTLLSMDSRNG
jgi:hypothetical protein